MKKYRFLSLLLCFVFLFGSVTAVKAEELSEEVVVDTKYFENGDYMVITIKTEKIEATTYGATPTVRGSKTINYYNSADEIVWDHSVLGTFEYNGSYAKATYVGQYNNIYASGWEQHSSSTEKYSNIATGSIQMRYYSLGLLMQIVNDQLTLTCDKNGKIV